MYIKIGPLGRITLSTLFWLCIQICVIIALEILGLLPSRLFHVGLYGIQGTIAGYVYTHVCCIVGVVYTITGAIIMEKEAINSKRWWLIVGGNYLLFIIVTAIGMLYAQGAWFWEGYGAYLLDVWFAPILWLVEIEIVHLYWTNQRQKYLSKTDIDSNLDYPFKTPPQ